MHFCASQCLQTVVSCQLRSFSWAHFGNNAANTLSTNLKRQFWTCFSPLYSVSITIVLCFNDLTIFVNTWKEQYAVNRQCCSLFKVRHLIAKDAPLNHTSWRVTKKKEKNHDMMDDPIIWYQFVTCSRWEQEGAADAIGQRQTRLASHKRGSRGSFHLTHTHTEARTHRLGLQTSETSEKSSKVK